jgi:hypothetical protein
MPKPKDIRGLLQKQIDDLTKKLSASRTKLGYYQQVVRAQEDELAKLENAGRSLDGTAQPKTLASPYSESGSETIRNYQIPSNIAPSIFHGPVGKTPQTAIINGETVVIEHGFHVEKNSFGEDCIVPDGVEYAPAAEPTPTPDTNSHFGGGMPTLPAITSGDTFDDPADIISAELPNG